MSVGRDTKKSKFFFHERMHYTKTVDLSCTYFVPCHVLYKAFLDSRDLSRIALSNSVVNPTVGGEFSMYNGGVTGSIVELVPDEKIVQKWRFSQWAPGCYSTLELTFIRKGDSRTELRVHQTGIPERDHHDNPDQEVLVINGWNDKFFMTLEKVLGFPRDRDE